MITIVGVQAACDRARQLITERVAEYYSGSGAVSGSGIRTSERSHGLMPPVSTKGVEASHYLETGEIPQAPKIKFVPPSKSVREPSRRPSKSQAKDSGKIIACYNTMRAAGATPTKSTFNVAIKAYANSGDVSGAERCIDAMWQAGFTPNAFSFNAVINRCARAGDVRSAERWLSLMQDAGATPNQLTFNLVIQAYTLAADPAGAVRWFQTMQTAKVPANEKTFSSIVNAHAQAKDVSGAERWFEASQQDGFKPDVISFNTVINACAQVRDVARGERWLKAMQEAGLQPNQVTFNIMIKAHALSGDAAGAERWFEQMKQAGFSHNLRSFSSMATAYGQEFTVDLSKVDEMVAEMRALQLYPDHEVLTSLLKCCAHAQPPQPAVALSWFREFIPRAQLMPHVERALRQAVGNNQADQAISWAKQVHPQLFQLQPLHGGRGSNTGNRIANTGGSVKVGTGDKYTGAGASAVHQQSIEPDKEPITEPRDEINPPAFPSPLPPPHDKPSPPTVAESSTAIVPPIPKLLPPPPRPSSALSPSAKAFEIGLLSPPRSPLRASAPGFTSGNLLVSQKGSRPVNMPSAFTTAQRGKLQLDAAQQQFPQQFQHGQGQLGEFQHHHHYHHSGQQWNIQAVQHAHHQEQQHCYQQQHYQQQQHGQLYQHLQHHHQRYNAPPTTCASRQMRQEPWVRFSPARKPSSAIKIMPPAQVSDCNVLTKPPTTAAVVADDLTKEDVASLSSILTIFTELVADD